MVKNWIHRSNPHLNKGEMEFFNRENESSLFIFDRRKMHPFIDEWQVSHDSSGLEKNFKTKSQALKFARNYMKKHPRG